MAFNWFRRMGGNLSSVSQNKHCLVCLVKFNYNLMFTLFLTLQTLASKNKQNRTFRQLVKNVLFQRITHCDSIEQIVQTSWMRSRIIDSSWQNFWQRGQCGLIWHPWQWGFLFLVFKSWGAQTLQFLIRSLVSEELRRYLCAAMGCIFSNLIKLINQRDAML